LVVDMVDMVEDHLAVDSVEDYHLVVDLVEDHLAAVFL
jgi:hypothetical protein